jgi:hypothetical protein
MSENAPDITDNTNRFFRGQMADEEVMAFSRKHWIAIMPEVIPFAFFFSFVVLTLLLVNKFKLPSLSEPFFQMLVVVAMTGACWLIHRFFLRMFRYFFNVVIITNYRIVEIKKTLFIKDTKESLDMRKVQGVDFRQEGLIKNLLKVGELEISMGNSETKTLSQIPNPDFHFRLINKLKNDVFLRQQRPLDSFEKGPANGAAGNPQAVTDGASKETYYTRSMV